MNFDIDDSDIDILIYEVLETSGYDFSNYSRASFKRRVGRLLDLDKFKSLEHLRHVIKTDKKYLQRFVEEITVNVTEMFRDPEFYNTLRNKILPQLATKPFIRIWHAGCSTGEEVYSMAILLKEANILDKSLIYATDINPGVLLAAKKGIYPLKNMKLNSENYIECCGKEDFSSFYTAQYDRAIINDSLKKKIIFSTHNLVSDRSFNEFQIILCRNVLIYFDKTLQNKVLKVFDQSLENLGFLALGSKETLRFSNIMENYIQIDNQKIWKKIYHQEEKK
ncbi:MAG: protein-glutamate O-methyltransferase CheR [Ferruginibacter sp.]